MKTFFKKGLITVLAAAMAIASMTTLVGCGPRGEQIDATKTQLHVSNYDGGFGTEWLYAAKDRFTELVKDVSFESGKTGVQIHINPNRDEVGTNIQAGTDNIYFSQDIRINDLITQGLVADISDIVTEETLADVSDGAETGKIVDKLNADWRSVLTALDGKYYALPHNSSFAGMSYDAKLFTAKRYYLKAQADGSWNGQTNAGGWTNVDADKTVGPNGVRGDYDDGLPSTLEELTALFNRIAQIGDEPLIWPGRHTWYVSLLAEGLWTNLSGADEAKLSFDFGSETANNTMRVVTGFNGDTPIVETKTITPATGYLTKQSEARYYMVKAMYDVLSNVDKYLSKDWTGALCHTETQYEYIYSDLESAKDGNSIAMIVDGCWWYNEAKSAFASSEKTYTDDARNRDFRYMPLPWKVSGGVKEGEGRKPTLLDDASSYAIINAKTTPEGGVRDAAKMFLKFLYTDSECIAFQTTTGAPKSVNYTLPDKTKKGMNSFYRSVADIVADANVVLPASAHGIYVHNQSDFMPLRAYIFGSTVNNTEYEFPYNIFTQKQVTVKQYFQGMAITQADWTSAYGTWLA